MSLSSVGNSVHDRGIWKCRFCITKKRGGQKLKGPKIKGNRLTYFLKGVNRDHGSRAFEITMKTKENYSKKSLPISSFLILEYVKNFLSYKFPSSNSIPHLKDGLEISDKSHLGVKNSETIKSWRISVLTPPSKQDPSTKFQTPTFAKEIISHPPKFIESLIKNYSNRVSGLKHYHPLRYFDDSKEIIPIAKRHLNLMGFHFFI